MNTVPNQQSDKVDPAFGGSESYYSRERRSGEPFEKRHVEMLKSALARGTDTAIRRAVTNWRRPLRDVLNDEMRLSLGDARLTVEVVDGLPAPFAEIVDEFDDPILWWLLLSKPTFAWTRHGLDLLQGRFTEISLSPKFASLPPDAAPAIATASDTVKMILDGLEDKELIDRLEAIDRDVLGAYFFHRGRIELYWIVIAIFARIWSLNAEDLAAIVLAHELAHAFTHVGRDIGGRQWATKDFAGASLNIVEGLAQYYAQRAGERLSDRHPGLLVAFQGLLQHQSGPYVVHQEWLSKPSNLGEALRQALLHCRLHQIKEYNSFREEIADAQSRLSSEHP